MIAAVVIFISLLRSDYAWFWSFLGSAIGGFLVYLYITPVIFFALLAFIVFVLYVVISALDGFG